MRNKNNIELYDIYISVAGSSMELSESVHFIHFSCSTTLHFFADQSSLRYGCRPTSVHSSAYLSVVVCHGCIVVKRCEIGPRWLLITNIESHTPYQMKFKKNHRPWMTSKVTDNQYGRLS